jgi:hypothetical protein
MANRTNGFILCRKCNKSIDSLTNGNNHNCAGDIKIVEVKGRKYLGPSGKKNTGRGGKISGKIYEKKRNERYSGPDRRKRAR